MITIFFIIVNIVLFLGSLVGGFFAHSYQVTRKFGVVQGAVAGHIPNEKEQRALDALSFMELVGCVLLSLVTMYVMGFDKWASFMFSPTVGIIIGIVLLNRMARSRIKPASWS